MKKLFIIAILVMSAVLISSAYAPGNVDTDSVAITTTGGSYGILSTDVVASKDVEEEPADSVDLSVIENANCWADKPAYRPGIDKGYFIWQGKCANFIWVDWSGDTKAKWKKWRKIKDGIDTDEEEPTVSEVEEVEAEIIALTEEETAEAESENVIEVVNVDVAVCPTECDTSDIMCPEGKIIVSKTDNCGCVKKRCIVKPKLLYEVQGRIISNGQIFDVGTRKFDGYDVLRFNNNEIKFKAKVGPHFDGIYFRTTGAVVLMELWFDGEKETKVINIGKNKRHPENNPFKMKVRPAEKPRTCADGEMIYNRKCVRNVGTKTVSTAPASGGVAVSEQPPSSGSGGGSGVTSSATTDIAMDESGAVLIDDGSFTADEPGEVLAKEVTTAIDVGTGESAEIAGMVPTLTRMQKIERLKVIRTRIQAKKLEILKNENVSKKAKVKLIRKTNMIREAAHNLIALRAITGERTGIGQNLSVIAREFNNSAEKIEGLESKIEKRGRIRKLLFGGDVNSAEELNSEIAKVGTRIIELENIKNELTDEESQAVIDDQIEVMKDEKARLERIAAAEKKSRGIFGWLFR